MDIKWKSLIEKGAIFLEKKWISVPGLVLTVLGSSSIGCLPQVLFHGDCAGVWDIAECLYVVWDFASSKAVFGTEVSRLGQWAEAWY